MNEASILPVLLMLLIVWEIFFPAQRNGRVFSARRVGNVTLFPISAMVSVLMKPQLLAILSLLSFDFGQGLMASLVLSPWLKGVLSFLLLDASMYFQHRLFHASRFFWRFHVLHHSDTAVDVTTYFRHHPLETLVSGVMTFVIAVLLGVTPTIFAIYLLINNVMQLIQHSNIDVPLWLGRIDWLLVTPSFHAQHHALDRSIADTNFSTIFTWWDRIGGTYRKNDTYPLSFGVRGFESEQAQFIGTMLAMPALVYLKRD